MVKKIIVDFSRNEISQMIANDLPNSRRYPLEGADVSISHDHNEATIVVTPMAGCGIIIHLK